MIHMHCTLWTIMSKNSVIYLFLSSLLLSLLTDYSCDFDFGGFWNSLSEDTGKCLTPQTGKSRNKVKATPEHFHFFNWSFVIVTEEKNNILNFSLLNFTHKHWKHSFLVFCFTNDIPFLSLLKRNFETL